ncbi:hypothetical protein QOZ80_7AG0569840 [Eleusine coracana subsp. coracana]|nr:hypothetical protein QOZ80_7AG0569840 [Eleusine coracana subsp. coracana]
MLKHLLPHHGTFSSFINSQYQQVHGRSLLTPDDWYVAKKVCDFLEQFYESTNILFGVYYSTSNLIIHQLIDIADHLCQFENDRYLRYVVVPMKSKYLKYWQDIPILYALAFVLDPRSTMKGLGNALKLLSDHLHHDYSAYFTTVRSNCLTSLLLMSLSLVLLDYKGKLPQ